MFVCDKQKTVTLCFVFLNETWIYLQAAKLEISETTRKFQKEIKLKELYYYVMKAKELGKKKKRLETVSSVTNEDSGILKYEALLSVKYIKLLYINKCLGAVG